MLMTVCGWPGISRRFRDRPHAHRCDYALTMRWKTRYNEPRGGKSREGTSRRQPNPSTDELEEPMSNSVYKIIELVGTSTESWEDAARAAVERASSSLRDLRIAEVVKLDLQIKDGKVEAYRAKVSVSFKYENKE
jgi:flavin-binding protein dodecin